MTSRYLTTETKEEKYDGYRIKDKASTGELDSDR